MHGLTDFLMLATLKDCIHFVSIKNNENSLRNVSTLELS